MHRLLQKYPILSDQITKNELDVVLTFAEKSLGSIGDYVEFGCYSGTTSLFLSRLLENTGKSLWVYDSFEGLPEKSQFDASPAGFAFNKGELSYSKKQFINNYKKASLPIPTITKGWFKNIKPDQLPEKIAFAFLDGDYYESVLTSLKLVVPLISKNGFVLVHDYGRVTLPGSKKAVEQFLKTNKALKLTSVQEHIAILSSL